MGALLQDRLAGWPSVVTYDSDSDSPYRKRDPISKTRECLGETKNILGVTLNVLSSVRTDVLGRRSTQALFSLRLRERRRSRRTSAALLSQSAYTERPIPPLPEEETSSPSSGKGDTQERDFIGLLWEIILILWCVTDRIENGASNSFSFAARTCFRAVAWQRPDVTQTNPQTLFWCYTDHIESDASNSSSLSRVLFATGTCIPSHCLATIEWIHNQAHRLMGRIYEV
jgi:hypothetical protein